MTSGVSKTSPGFCCDLRSKSSYLLDFEDFNLVAKGLSTSIENVLEIEILCFLKLGSATGFDALLLRLSYSSSVVFSGT